jgi:hypothetical protein
VATAAITLAVGLGACGTTTLKSHPDGGNQSDGSAGTGSGGAAGAGSGGAAGTGAGGAAGMATGGSVGTGGAPGVGGATSVGGATGAGGQVDAGSDALPTCAGTVCSIAFASDGTWRTYDADPASVPGAHAGNLAQPVCLNASAPPNCPSGAFLYGVPVVAWTTDLTTIPGAQWIWAPDIVATDVSDLRKVFVSRTFLLGASPSGQLRITADDAARVLVNGTDVGGVGSVTTPGAGFALMTIDVSVALHPGSNTITIAAQNGPASFGGCPSSCTYQMNPAGVVFGGTLNYH